MFERIWGILFKSRYTNVRIIIIIIIIIFFFLIPLGVKIPRVKR